MSRSTPTRVGKTDELFKLIDTGAVHPHACGENTSPQSPDCCQKGPPPRVWGKLADQRVHFAPQRSTPTRVGKTASSPRKEVKMSVHPHACGENTYNWIRDCARGGPPPRVWGKRDYCLGVACWLRSTPTRVGKTIFIAVPYKHRSVHPHACGENGWQSLFCAGYAVHPHACGENPQEVGPLPVRIGPPPRVWGKRCCLICILGKNRSTPTRVGKTILLFSSIL